MNPQEADENWPRVDGWGVKRSLTKRQRGQHGVLVEPFHPLPAPGRSLGSHENRRRPTPEVSHPGRQFAPRSLCCSPTFYKS